MIMHISKDIMKVDKGLARVARAYHKQKGVKHFAVKSSHMYTGDMLYAYVGKRKWKAIDWKAVIMRNARAA